MTPGTWLSRRRRRAEREPSGARAVTGSVVDSVEAIKRLTMVAKRGLDFALQGYPDVAHESRRGADGHLRSATSRGARTRWSALHHVPPLGGRIGTPAPGRGRRRRRRERSPLPRSEELALRRDPASGRGAVPGAPPRSWSPARPAPAARAPADP